MEKTTFKKVVATTTSGVVLCASLLTGLSVASAALGNEYRNHAEYAAAYQYGFANKLTTLSFENSMPEMTFTREQLASFAVGFAGEYGAVHVKNVDTSAQCEFSDIKTADPNLVGVILQSCRLGLLQGYQGKFMPKGKVTRAQVVAVIVRAMLGKKLDESVAPWYTNYMNEAIKKGVITQRRPEDVVTRFEAFLMFYRADKPKTTSTTCDTTQKILCLAGGDAAVCAACGITAGGGTGNNTGTGTNNGSGTVAQKGDLQVALSAKTPAAQDIPKNAQQVEFLTFDVTPTQNTKVTEFVFELKGLASRNDFDAFTLMVNNQPVSRDRRVASDNKLTIKGNWDFKKGETTSITLVGQLDVAASKANITPRFALVDVKTNAKKTVGLPVEGNTMRTSDYKVSTLTLEGRGSSTYSELNVGTKKATIGEFAFSRKSGDSRKDIILKSIKLENNGKFSLSKGLENVTLYDKDGKVVSTSVVIEGDFVTFALKDFVIKVSDNDPRFVIKADVVGGEDGDTLEFTLDNTYDVFAFEKGSSFGVKVTDDTASRGLGKYKINAGAFYVSPQNSTKTVSTSDNRKGILVYEAKVTLDQPVEFQSMKLFVSSFSGTASGPSLSKSDYEKYITKVVVKVNDSTLTDAEKLASSSSQSVNGDAYYYFRDSGTLKNGDVIRVYADIGKNVPLNTFISYKINNTGVSVGNSKSFEKTKYVSDNERVTKDDFSGSQRGMTLKIVDLSNTFTVTRTDNHATNNSTVYVAGGPALFTQTRISNTQYDDVVIKKLVYNVTLGGALNRNNIGNLILKKGEGDKAVQIGRPGRMDNDTSGSVVFESLNIKLKKGEQITLQMGSEATQQGTTGTIVTALQNSKVGNSVFEDSNGNEIKLQTIGTTPNNVFYTTPTINVIDKASLDVRSFNKPVSSLLMSKDTNAYLGSWRFKPSEGSVELKELKFAAQGSVPNNFRNVFTDFYVTVNDKKVPVTTNANANGEVLLRMEGKSNTLVSLDKNENTVKLYATIANIDSAIETNVPIQMKLVDVKANTQGSSVEANPITYGADVTENMHYTRKTKITVTPETFSASARSLGAQNLYRALIKANDTGSANIAKMSFDIIANNVSVSDLKLYAGDKNPTGTPIATSTEVITGGTKRITFNIAAPESVNSSANTYFTVKGNITPLSGTTASTQNVTVRITNDSTPNSGTLASLTGVNSIVWTDNVDNNLWFNGYLISDLSHQTLFQNNP